MARLFSLADAVAHDDPEYGHFVPGKDGGFAFPDDLSDRLLRFHVRGRPLWEDEIRRQQRAASEELARQRDPAYLAELVAQLLAAAQGSAPAPAGQEAAPVKRPAPRRPAEGK